MKKILCYDKDFSTAEAIHAILSNAGYEVELLNEAASLTNKVEDGNYDIVLLDAAMPKFSIPETFKGLAERIDSSLVLMSHRPISHDKLAQLKNAGVSDILMKPFTKEEIIKTVQRIVEQRELADGINQKPAAGIGN